MPASITLNTSTNPTSCGGNEGSISIGGLANAATYTVMYDQDGTTVTTNLTIEWIRRDYDLKFYQVVNYQNIKVNQG